MLEIVLTLACLSGALWVFLSHVEHWQMWTLRLWISRVVFTTSFTLLFTAALLSLFWYGAFRANVDYDLRGRTSAAIFAAVVAVLFGLVLPVLESRAYVKARWKAWTGPSRTGIPFRLVRYLGDQQDWKSMRASCTDIQLHPVERVVALLPPYNGAIAEDPTDILNARAMSDEELDAVWVPRSDVKTGMYQPVEPDQPVSLLWGEHLGFKARCSRGIISVPRNLLTYQPVLQNGIDGRPLCLAHAILARNKGLAPATLVCNIQSKGSYRAFEENSVFWPRPAKTYRSLYRAEISRSFSGLGSAYITAATELALLLADAGYGLISDWLDGHMEQQDLELNNFVASKDASHAELDILYRGSYAAMLVSLSLHRLGVRVRPEITIFKALWQQEGHGALPHWLLLDEMVERDHEETRVLGESGRRLMEAVV